MEAKDELQDRYGIVTVSVDQLDSLDPAAIIGKRIHAFGADVLVDRAMVPKDLDVEKASIEDIMVYWIKGARS